MRRRPGGAYGGGDGGARGETKALHAREKIVTKFLLAAEEVRAAADVEQNAVGAIHGDQRRVALAPIGKGIEEARVGCLVLRHRNESGMHGAGLRQRQTVPHSRSFRRGINSDKDVDIAALAEDDKRLRCLMCVV